MRYLWLTAVIVVLPLRSQKPENDWLLIAGVRAGPIMQKSQRSDLSKYFGGSNVVDEPIDFGEGAVPTTIIYKNHPDREIDVLWNNNKPELGIYKLVFCPSGVTCLWHTQHHIRFGTTLKTLEALNGGAFEMSGFDWENPGGASSWQHAALSDLRGKCGWIFVRLGPKGFPLTSVQRVLVDQIQGDNSYSSANPALQKLNPSVDDLQMIFDSCSAP